MLDIKLNSCFYLFLMTTIIYFFLKHEGLIDSMKLSEKKSVCSLMKT